MLIKNFCLTTEVLNYVSKSDNPETSEEDEGSNDSYQYLDNQEENNQNMKFYEWLAGVIDGDGCFLVSKKRIL